MNNNRLVTQFKPFSIKLPVHVCCFYKQNIFLSKCNVSIYLTGFAIRKQNTSFMNSLVSTFCLNVLFRNNIFLNIRYSRKQSMTKEFGVHVTFRQHAQRSNEPQNCCFHGSQHFEITTKLPLWLFLIAFKILKSPH